MPLNARLNNEMIYAWDMDEREWLDLRHSPEAQKLTMGCCDRKAIMRKSVLGTQHFAHARRGECTTASETPEHLYLKSVAARAAKAAGWKVTTEHHGQTPEGEKWIADVFCQKGDTRVAIEIQWSRQSVEEFVRRQVKYRSSGVRCAWLHKEFSNQVIINHRDLPVFYFSKDEDGGFILPQFRTNVETFVTGLMSGSVKWLPEPSEILTKSYICADLQCPTCKGQSSNVVATIYVDQKLNRYSYVAVHIPYEFDEMSRCQVLRPHQGSNIGPILPEVLTRQHPLPQHACQICLQCHHTIGIESLVAHQFSSPFRNGAWSDLRLNSNHFLIPAGTVATKEMRLDFGIEQKWCFVG